MPSIRNFSTFSETKLELPESGLADNEKKEFMKGVENILCLKTNGLSNQ